MPHHEGMRSSALAAASALIVLGSVQACGSTTSGVPSPTPSASGTGIEVSLELPQTTVHAGATIKATLVLDNLTGKPVKPGCGVMYAVGVTNAQIPFDPAFPAYCAANQSLPVGITRYAVTIITTYQGCSESGKPDGAMPGCLPGPKSGISTYTTPPPLPKGEYHTAIVLTGPPSNLIRLPQPITITLN